MERNPRRFRELFLTLRWLLVACAASAFAFGVYIALRGQGTDDFHWLKWLFVGYIGILAFGLAQEAWERNEMAAGELSPVVERIGPTRAGAIFACGTLFGGTAYLLNERPLILLLAAMMTGLMAMSYLLEAFRRRVLGAG